jgi:hypothetical protein
MAAAAAAATTKRPSMMMIYGPLPICKERSCLAEWSLVFVCDIP